MPLVFALMAAAFGACVGSFAVTVAYRLPREISIVTPGSYCPGCDRPIPWYANIPIFAYLALRGRCAMCGARIPLRHLLAELAMALIALWLFVSFPIADAVARFILVAALLVCSLVDYDWRLIPNLVALPGIPIGFALAALVIHEVGWQSSLIGIALGGGALFLTGYIYQLLRRQEGVGLGDVFLLAMIGAFLGWQGVLFTLFFGALAGSLGGITVAIFGNPSPAPELPPFARDVGQSDPASTPGTLALSSAAAASESGEQVSEEAQPSGERENSVLGTEVPFGPFLSLAAVLFAVFQPQLINWYLR